MIERFTSGTYAGNTIEQASGENSDNSGPGLPVIGAVAVAGYAAYKVLM